MFTVAQLDLGEPFVRERRRPARNHEPQRRPVHRVKVFSVHLKGDKHILVQRFLDPHAAGDRQVVRRAGKVRVGATAP